MAWPHADGAKFPNSVRLLVAMWLLIWIPAYWRTWGVSNFLQLCDVAAVLTCIGLLSSNALLLSSQALASLLIDLAWALDAGVRFFLGRSLLGGTDYLFDPQYPLWVRLLSLFHLVLPLLLIWALLRVGYDRRALALQSAITLAVFSAARFTSSEKNMNFAFRDPFFHRSWGPPPVHILVSVLFMIVVVYLPTHRFLQRLVPVREP